MGQEFHLCVTAVHSPGPPCPPPGWPTTGCKAISKAAKEPSAQAASSQMSSWAQRHVPSVLQLPGPLYRIPVQRDHHSAISTRIPLALGTTLLKLGCSPNKFKRHYGFNRHDSLLLQHLKPSFSSRATVRVPYPILSIHKANDAHPRYLLHIVLLLCEISGGQSAGNCNLMRAEVSQSASNFRSWNLSTPAATSARSSPCGGYTGITRTCVWRLYRDAATIAHKPAFSSCSGYG